MCGTIRIYGRKNKSPLIAPGVGNGNLTPVFMGYQKVGA